MLFPNNYIVCLCWKTLLAQHNWRFMMMQKLAAIGNADAESEAAPSVQVTIDVSDLLGANQAFLPEYDAKKQSELIDAYCNKIGSECCC
jgi:hypothetical protein